jgi:hypothetical protein
MASLHAPRGGLCLRLLIAAFAIAGTREQARAIGGFVPDCAVLFQTPA